MKPDGSIMRGQVQATYDGVVSKESLSGLAIDGALLHELLGSEKYA